MLMIICNHKFESTVALHEVLKFVLNTQSLDFKDDHFHSSVSEDLLGWVP